MKSHTKTRVLPKPTVTPVRKQPRQALVRLPVQPALRVGAVSDPAEREAETMAARVVGATAPTQTAPAPNTLQPAAVLPLRRNAEDQPNLDDLQPEPPGAEQQDFDLPDSQDVAPDDLGTEDMAELESGTPADTGGEVAPLRRDTGPKAAVGRMGGTAPPDVSRAVANPGPGRPLPSGLRARVEPHFQRSFEDVRLHDQPQDQEIAARIGARAFTHKTNIWLGQGESPTNARLMAHELTHVVQQTDGADRLPINRNEVQREPIQREEDDGYIAGKLEGYARYVPGYTLATVILGKTLISGKRVLKTAENLLGGLFGLHPLGTVLFDKLRETRMVQEAYDWTVTRLGQLNLTWSRVKGIIDKVWDAPWTGTMNYIKGLFKPLVTDLITFAKEVGQKVLEFAVRGALKLAGPYADKVWAVIQQARDVLHLIIEDPLRFAKNLILAIVGGFGRFAKNIFEHLKKGLLGWLFGAVANAGITMPEKLDFKGLMSLVMQILGLTYANFRKQLVKKLGPSGERKVAMIEKSVEIVKILLKEGFAGIWRKMLEMIENFKSTLIGGISQMVITTVIKAGIGWLAGLSNPIGGVVKICLAIYDLIVAFLERLEQIMAVAQSIFSSVGAIARGKTEAAAKFVEETIGRTVPIVIAFLAALLGLGGISSKIKGIIKKLQAPVQKAMGKLIGFVIKKMKKLFSKIIAKLNGKRKLPGHPFKIGTADHSIFVKKEGKKVETYIATTPHKVPTVNQKTKEEIAGLEGAVAIKKAKEIYNEGVEANEEIEPHARQARPASEKVNQRKIYARLNAELKEAADELGKAGRKVTEIRELSEEAEDTPALYRAVEPRIDEIEGDYAETQDALKASVKSKVSGLKDTGIDPDQLFTYYELDHTIEKRFPKAIVENLHLFGKKKDGSDSGVTVEHDAPEVLRGGEPRKDRNRAKDERTNQTTAYAEEGETSNDLGGLGGTGIREIAEDAPNLPAIALFQQNHIRKKGANLMDHEAIVEDAMGHGKAWKTQLRKSLKKQMETEISEIEQTYKADKSVKPKTKQKVSDGLAQLRSINNRIYSLRSNTQEREDTAEEAKKKREKPFDPAGSSEQIPFNGGPPFPNFIEIEGIGGPYRTTGAGYGRFLERDHVIDRNYPDQAQKLKIVTPQRASLAKGKLSTPTGGKKSSITWMLKRAEQRPELSVFRAGSTLQNYTENNGFAIPLYRPVAKNVTRDTETPRKLAGYTSANDEDVAQDLADYVENNKDQRYLDAAARRDQQVLKPVFKNKTDEHVMNISNRYAEELGAVRILNQAKGSKNDEKAYRSMRRIAMNVKTSLGKARAQTDGFFN